MRRFLLAAGMLAGALSAAALSSRPALAQQSKVGDWTIEKRTQDTHCNASRGYKDKEDENRDYVIVITYSDKAIVIVMIYEAGSGTRSARSSGPTSPPMTPIS
ncbi:hypothetical protein QIH76_22675 [Bradyrhizobium diazoefficiens]|nr:hypothetical protein [Bradyrhizobium diazoefficiens]WLC12973.1 hypothetical protein QIH76_22675 [Bradyrhizobium diazoefficiens]